MVKAGVLKADEFVAFRRSLSATAGDDVLAFAKAMVKAEQITRWQASEVWKSSSPTLLIGDR